MVAVVDRQILERVEGGRRVERTPIAGQGETSATAMYPLHPKSSLGSRPQPKAAVETGTPKCKGKREVGEQPKLRQ